MATHAPKIDWCYQTLPSKTKKALDFLTSQQWLKDSAWYLAGGTALALQVGNRQSLDLDFFSTESDVNLTTLLEHFRNNTAWNTSIEEKNTIYGELFGVKISFIAYPFFVPRRKWLWHGSVRVLDKIDIAVMKIVAISQRGKKRDFFDVYWCAKNLESLEETIKRLPAQYPSVAHDYHHILKSLVYFDDAESDPDPEIFFKASWPEIKNFFIQEIPGIAKKLIDLS